MFFPPLLFNNTFRSSTPKVGIWCTWKNERQRPDLALEEGTGRCQLEAANSVWKAVALLPDFSQHGRGLVTACLSLESSTAVWGKEEHLSLPNSWMHKTNSSRLQPCFLLTPCHLSAEQLSPPDKTPGHPRFLSVSHGPSVPGEIWLASSLASEVTTLGPGGCVFLIDPCLLAGVRWGCIEGGRAVPKGQGAGGDRVTLWPSQLRGLDGLIVYLLFATRVIAGARCQHYKCTAPSDLFLFPPSILLNRIERMCSW